MFCGTGRMEGQVVTQMLIDVVQHIEKRRTAVVDVDGYRSFQCLDGEFVRFCIMMPEDNTRLLDVLKQL